MERLKLDVNQSRPHQNGKRIGSDECEQALHPAGELLRTDRDEPDQPGIPVAHVILLRLELAGGLRRSPSPGKELPVDTFHQRRAQRIAFLKLLLSRVQRPPVEDRLDDLRADFGRPLFLGVLSRVLKDFIHRADGALHA